MYITVPLSYHATLERSPQSSAGVGGRRGWGQVGHGQRGRGHSTVYVAPLSGHSFGHSWDERAGLPAAHLHPSHPYCLHPSHPHRLPPSPHHYVYFVRARMVQVENVKCHAHFLCWPQRSSVLMGWSQTWPEWRVRGWGWEGVRAAQAVGGDPAIGAVYCAGEEG